MKLPAVAYGMLLAVLPVGSPANSANAQPDPQTQSPSAIIVFYADPGVGDTLWPPLFRTLRAELAREGRSYALPLDPHMMLARQATVAQQATDFVVVHLLGRCDIPHQAWRPLSQDRPLGWVYQVGGHIQPFIFVDCTRLAQFLNPVTLGMNDPQRTDAMTLAISRVIIHEWIHINLQTAAHATHGIRRPELSADDLVEADPPGFE
jgi:hypothetical protein